LFLEFVQISNKNVSNYRDVCVTKYSIDWCTFVHRAIVKLLPFRINPKQFVIVFTKVSFEIESQKSPVLKTNKFLLKNLNGKVDLNFFVCCLQKIFQSEIHLLL